MLRTLPSSSVDLVYMDPPFFSNQDYSVIWGDALEVRSFKDTWDGGLPGYLIWLNARLWEMKRVLKPSGSIYVHCDDHASHYIKVEMDRIFGSENFRNEITWKRQASNNAAKRAYGRNADTVLFYTRGAEWVWNQPYFERSEIETKRYKRDADGRLYKLNDLTAPGHDPSRMFTWRGTTPTRNWGYSRDRLEDLWAAGLIQVTKDGRPRTDGRITYLDESAPGQKAQVLWTDIERVGNTAAERVGYPTQKPEALLERIVKASSNEGGVVLDPFVGGGTTAVVAQRLNRRWIAIDQSRMAVSVTEQRLRADERQGELGEARQRGFEVRYWGVYEAEALSAMEPDEFRRFVAECYGARPETDGSAIHGWRRDGDSDTPIWAGGPSPRAAVSPADVAAFARAIAERCGSGASGVMLAWGFGKRAEAAALAIAERENLGIEFVKVRQLPLDSEDFRAHVRAKEGPGSYGRLLTFVHAPAVRVSQERRGPRAVALDAGETRVTNPGAVVVSVQWDFDYNCRSFRADRRHWYRKGKELPLAIEHEFEGKATHFKVACRVQDSLGGEGTAVIDVDVEA